MSCVACGHEVEMIDPSRFRTIPCPTYPEIRLALGCGRAVARLLDRVAARQRSHLNGRPDRLGGAELVPEARASLHHRVPHALSGLCLDPHRHSRGVDLDDDAPLPWRGRADIHCHGNACRGAARARLCAHAPLAARSRSCAIQPRCHAARRDRRSAAADPAQRRPRCSREEYRGVPRS